jgi:hypothetical protein
LAKIIDNIKILDAIFSLCGDEVPRDAQLCKSLYKDIVIKFVDQSFNFAGKEFLRKLTIDYFVKIYNRLEHTLNVLASSSRLKLRDYNIHDIYGNCGVDSYCSTFELIRSNPGNESFIALGGMFDPTKIRDPHRFSYKRHNENGQEMYNGHEKAKIIDKTIEERREKVIDFLKSHDRNVRRKFHELTERYDKNNRKKCETFMRRIEHERNTEREKKADDFLESCDKNNRANGSHTDSMHEISRVGRKFYLTDEQYEEYCELCRRDQLDYDGFKKSPQFEEFLSKNQLDLCPFHINMNDIKFLMTRKECDEVRKLHLIAIDQQKGIYDKNEYPFLLCGRGNYILSLEDLEEVKKLLRDMCMSNTIYTSDTDQSDALIDLLCTNDLSSGTRVHASYLAWRYNTNAWVQRNPFLQPSEKEKFSRPPDTGGANRKLYRELDFSLYMGSHALQKPNVFAFSLLKHISKFDAKCNAIVDPFYSRQRTMLGAYGISAVSFCSPEYYYHWRAEFHFDYDKSEKRRFLVETTAHFEEPAWVDLGLSSACIVNPFSFFVGVGHHCRTKLILQY